MEIEKLGRGGEQNREKMSLWFSPSWCEISDSNFVWKKNWESIKRKEGKWGSENFWIAHHCTMSLSLSHLILLSPLRTKILSLFYLPKSQILKERRNSQHLKNDSSVSWWVQRKKNLIPMLCSRDFLPNQLLLIWLSNLPFELDIPFAKKWLTHKVSHVHLMYLLSQCRGSSWPPSEYTQSFLSGPRKKRHLSSLSLPLFPVKERTNFPLSDPRIRTMRRESRDKRSWDKDDVAGGKASGKVRLKVGAQPGVF